jgi:hypothetical protein
MSTNFPLAQNESVRTALAAVTATDDTAPPAFLRSHVLAQYRQRKRRSLSAAIAAVLMATGCTGWLLQISGPAGNDADWHARSVALEASWRETGDNDWLQSDARAESLLLRLREVDSRLAGLLGLAHTTDESALAALWKERGDVLSALIESRRQGGLAVRL